MNVLGGRLVHLSGILLVFIPNALATDDVTLSQLYHAFEDSYNPQQSFEDNFYTILAIACPESVLCKPEQQLLYIYNNTETKTSTAKTETTKVTAKTETAPVTAKPEITPLPTDISNRNNTDMAFMAREFLLNNIHLLTGCCTECACGADCSENGNCCLDSGKRNDIPNMSPVCVPASIYTHIPTLYDVNQDSYFMISDCYEEYPNPDVREKCQHPNIEYPDQVWPVFSKSTRKIYWNKFCAECNLDEDVIIWQVRVVYNFPGLYFFPESLLDLYELFLKRPKLFLFLFEPPNEVAAIVDEKRCKVHLSKTLITAPPTCIYGETGNPKSQFIHDACFYPKANNLVYKYGKYFRNVFCTICKIETFVPEKNRCETLSQRFLTRTLVSLLDLDSLTGSDLPKDDLDDLGNGNSLCTCTEWFDALKGECRPILCPPGEVYEKCECKRFMKDVSGIPVFMHLQIHPLSHMYVEDIAGIYTQMKHIKQLMSKITHQLQTITEEVTIEHYLAFLCQDGPKNFMYFVSSFVVKFGSDTRDIARLFYKTLLSGLPFASNGHQWLLNVGPVYKINYADANRGYLIEENSAIDRYSLLYSPPQRITNLRKQEHLLSKVLFCKRIALFSDEIQMLENGTILTTNLDYIFQSHDSSMCLYDFEMLFHPNLAGGSASITHWYIPNLENGRQLISAVILGFLLLLLFQCCNCF